MTSMFTELLSILIRSLRKNKNIRIGFLLGTGLIIILILFFFLTIRYWNFPIQNAIEKFTLPLLAIFGSLFSLSALSFTNVDITKNDFESQLEYLRLERKEIQKRIAESRQEEKEIKENVFDTIQLSLNQITEYYTINKNQAKNSFKFSVFAIVSGLITLIGGIWLFYFRNTPALDLTVITSISSLLIEFIGGAYFYIYSKSLKQLNFFYDKLVNMQDTMLAIELTESLPEEKSIVQKEKLISILMERSSPNNLNYKISS